VRLSSAAAAAAWFVDAISIKTFIYIHLFRIATGGSFWLLLLLQAMLLLLPSVLLLGNEMGRREHEDDPGR